MAECACYLVFHFCRILTLGTGETLFDYLMKRRLSEAVCDLLDAGASVTDVALDYQSGSPEAFARAFRRARGLSPSEWRRGGATTRDRLLAGATSRRIAQRLSAGSAGPAGVLGGGPPGALQRRGEDRRG
jgi:AraC-like DNA-binding protein